MLPSLQLSLGFLLLFRFAWAWVPLCSLVGPCPLKGSSTSLPPCTLEVGWPSLPHTARRSADPPTPPRKDRSIANVGRLSSKTLGVRARRKLYGCDRSGEVGVLLHVIREGHTSGVFLGTGVMREPVRPVCRSSTGLKSRLYGTSVKVGRIDGGRRGHGPLGAPSLCGPRCTIFCLLPRGTITLLHRTIGFSRGKLR